MRGLIVATAAAASFAAPAAASADYEPGYYTGKTAEGGSLVTRFDGGKVMHFGFGARAKCRTSSGRMRKTSGKYITRTPFPVAADGSFSVVNRARGNKLTVKGRVEGDRASGTFQLDFRLRDQRCKTATVGWSAERVGSG